MSAVFKRSVFYISGFDPKGAAHYHFLFRTQGALQSSRQGWLLEIGARQKTGIRNAMWNVKAQFGDHSVHTNYEFMCWDDVVRKHWETSWLTQWWNMVFTTFFYLRHGALWKIFCLSWPPAVALFAPFLMLWIAVLGVPSTAFAIGAGVSFWTGNSAPGWVVGCVISVVMWASVSKLATRFRMQWLMHSYAFTARQAINRVPEMDFRIDLLARRLIEQVKLAEDDELLVVAHSSGAILGVSVLARALQLAPDLCNGNTTISFLTLGQCIPLLGVLPMANKFRSDLQTLSSANGLTWIDFSAPSDGCCFAMTDPFTACDVGRPASGVNLKILNPRFASMFEPASYEVLKQDKLLMHFQYLYASAKLGTYDYFKITTGSVTLAARFAEEKSIDKYDALKPFVTADRILTWVKIHLKSAPMP